MVHLHLGCIFPRQELTKLKPQLCTPQNNTPKPIPYPTSVSSAAFGSCQDEPSTVCLQQERLCLFPWWLWQSCAGAGGGTQVLPWDRALVLGSAVAHHLQPRLVFSCWPSRVVPGPPHPQRRLVVPHGDINTWSAAAHLVPEMSLGNSNEKLNKKRPKRDRYRAHTRSERAKNSSDAICQSYRSLLTARMSLGIEQVRLQQ